MTRPAFGHREVKKLALPQETALREHAAYVSGGKPRRKSRSRQDGSPIDRALAWLSYFTLVSTAMIALVPDSAAAALLTVRTIVTTALPG